MFSPHNNREEGVGDDEREAQNARCAAAIPVLCSGRLGRFAATPAGAPCPLLLVSMLA